MNSGSTFDQKLDNIISVLEDEWNSPARTSSIEIIREVQRSLIRYEAENHALKRALDRNIIVNVYSDHVGYENAFQGAENASQTHSLAEGDPLFGASDEN